MSSEPITRPLEWRKPEVRFRLESWGELRSLPAPAWLVKGVIPEAGLCLIFGVSGSGKSFFTLDLAAHVALSLDWRGQRVKGGPVAYIAAEAAGTFRNRQEAWRIEKLSDAAEDPPLMVLRAAPDLHGGDDIGPLLEAIQRTGLDFKLIVVDTVARVMGGGDENSAKDVGLLVANLDRLRTETGAAVIGVHHAGKDSSKGARGSSALRAAVDLEIEVVGLSGTRSASITKSREGEIGAEFPFDLLPVEIAHDDDGEPITSCVAMPAEAATTSRKGGRKLPPRMKKALDILLDGIATQGEQPPVSGIAADVRAIRKTLWRDLCRARGLSAADDDRDKDRVFREAFQFLNNNNHIAVHGDHIWPVRG